MKLIWSGSVALDVIRRIISQSPQPEIKTETAKYCAEAIDLHLIDLILVASDANLNGRHSCAIALFRSMEDALDCFAATSLIPGAAEKWAEGKLRASKAAKLWEHKLGEIQLPTGEKEGEYRKKLRNYFNDFAHCSPYLTEWNVYPEFDSNKIKVLKPGDKLRSPLTARLKFYHQQKVLEQNAIRIGACLGAHTSEFIEVVEMAYKTFLTHNADIKAELNRSKDDIENLFKEEFGSVYLGNTPPQLDQPVFRHPDDPNLVMQLTSPNKHNNEDDTTVDNSG